jgi:separase
LLLRIWLIMATSVKTYVEAMQLAESISVDENGLSTAQRVAVKVALFERAAVAAHVFAVIQHCRVSMPPL